MYSLIASYQQVFCLKYQRENISAPHEVTEKYMASLMHQCKLDLQTNKGLESDWL